jgi:hypothetical protein
VTISFIRAVNIPVVTLRMSSLRPCDDANTLERCTVNDVQVPLAGRATEHLRNTATTTSPGGPTAAVVSAPVAEVKPLTFSSSMLLGDLSDSLIVWLA